MRLWHHHLCAKDIAYLDATGTIVRDFIGKRILYYAIVVCHPKESNLLMPVAEMISDDSTPTIHMFRRDRVQYSKERHKFPRQMNTDSY